VSAFTHLGDRYDVGQVIGRGGMAEVYEGTDRRLNRRVAIKVLRPDLARDPMFQERFRREAQSAAGLNHPNIVAIYDTGEDLVGDGSSQVSIPYIVMEYVDGVTLRHMLSNGPRILPERALEVIAGVLAALDYAHRHGIVHRDIKPANIMINSHGDAKVMDFGIARAMSDAATSVTATSAVMGTAQYLSPEQARGESVDARSDIYSTGCVLYELLTSNPPFNGESPVSIAYQHVNETPKLPSSTDPSIPPTLDSITMTALTKSPANRYQTAAEMRIDIERAIAGLPISNRPNSAPVDDGMNSTTVLPLTNSAPVTDAAVKTKSKRKKWITVAIATVVSALLLLVIGNQLLPKSQTLVTTPNLKSKTVDEAKIALTDIGLKLGTETPQADDNVPKGIVIGQDPAPGELLESGQAVNLIVSAGKDQVPVPDLVDLLSIEDARSVLTEAKLLLGRVTPVDSDKPDGTILEQNPAANVVVDVGALISVTVSNGKIPIPNVVGQNDTQAKNTLINAGFLVDIVKQADATVAAGIVLAQFPETDVLAAKGSIVTLTVASTPVAVLCPNGNPVPASGVCPSPSAKPSVKPSVSTSPTP
jgi:serine/threonine-protein kinase